MRLHHLLLLGLILSACDSSSGSGDGDGSGSGLFGAGTSTGSGDGDSTVTADDIDQVCQNLCQTMVNDTPCSPSLTVSECLTECSALMDAMSDPEVAGSSCLPDLLAVYDCAATVPGSSWTCDESGEPELPASQCDDEVRAFETCFASDPGDTPSTGGASGTGGTTGTAVGAPSASDWESFCGRFLAADCGDAPFSTVAECVTIFQSGIDTMDATCSAALGAAVRCVNSELVSPFFCDSETSSTTLSEAVCEAEQAAAENC